MTVVMQNVSIFRVVLSATRRQALGFASLSARRQPQNLVVFQFVCIQYVCTRAPLRPLRSRQEEHNQNVKGAEIRGP